MTGAALPLLIAAVLVGGAVQRVSGMGMGLILSPVLALLLGPAVGVTVTNMATVMSALLIGWVLRAGVDWRRFGLIASAALFGSIPGGLVVRAVPGSWLSVIIGATILVALGVTLNADRTHRLGNLHHPAWIVPFAAAAAFLNTIAGVAAPILVIYALAARWDQRSFAATLQPTFALFGFLSIVVKIGVGATPVSDLPDWWILPIMLAAIVAAVALGTFLSRHVSTQTARKIAIAAAGLGAVSALLRGLIDALG